METKYKLKALNVLIGGKLFKKEEGIIFDNKYPKAEVEAAYKAGFLVKVVGVEKPIVVDETNEEKVVEVEKPIVVDETNEEKVVEVEKSAKKK